MKQTRAKNINCTDNFMNIYNYRKRQAELRRSSSVVSNMSVERIIVPKNYAKPVNNVSFEFKNGKSIATYKNSIKKSKNSDSQKSINS